MTKIDRLEKALKQAYGESVVLMESDDNYCIARYEKGGHMEVVTLMHNWDTVFIGHYFNDIGNAWNDYYKRVK